jgi:ATP-dependent DNA helicase RecQ
MPQNTESPEVRAALRDVFGHDAFRGRQAEAVDAVLAGRDALLTMPTGTGKSLAYQLPAVVLDGLTLVVSPLIALMKDQVDALRRKGVRAAAVNSSVPAEKRERALKRALAGELDLLYVTPERFRSPRFREVCGDLGVTRLAVDEAHCVSQWGHDFRPDYGRLGLYSELVGRPPTLALTATATEAVADDIVELLELRDPLVIRTGIERPNLFLAATRVHLADEKRPLLAERIRQLGGAGIVYSALIKDLEWLHDELRRDGLETLVYHGKLSDSERRAMQERFMASSDAVVLATNAFGMGVDKPDIRFVLHAQTPRTLEAWTQEVGRAGRDGEPSWCELLYFEEDVAIQQNFVEWANPTLEYLVGVYEVLRGWGERVATKDLGDLRDELLVKNRGDNRVSICLRWLEVLGVTAGSFEAHDLRVVRELDPAELPEFLGTGEKREHDLRSLLEMVRFASGDGECRRVELARYFSLEEPDGDCGTCDRCTDAAAWRTEHVPVRTEAPRAAPSEPEEPADTDGGFRRGDWVRVGRHLGQVVKVERTSRGETLLVESASDLKRRKVDPARQRVRRVDG